MRLPVLTTRFQFLKSLGFFLLDPLFPFCFHWRHANPNPRACVRKVHRPSPMLKHLTAVYGLLSPLSERFSLRPGVMSALRLSPLPLCIALLCGALRLPPALNAAPVGPPLVVTQVPKGARPQDSGALAKQLDLPPGSRIVLVNTDGTLRNLTPGFKSARDPDVSFDGGRMIFAGRTERDTHPRVYELTFATGEARPVTPERVPARSPVYVSTLFTLDSPEPWSTVIFVGQGFDSPDGIGSALYSIRLDAPELRRITFNPHVNFDPAQMWDGRLLYASERPVLNLGWGKPRTQIFAVHTEGADVELYGGERGGPVQRMPCPTPSGLVVFVEPEPDASDGSGALCAIEEKRPHLTWRKLSKGKDRYLHPAVLSPQSILAARHNGRGSGFGIVSFDLQSGESRVLFDSPDYDDIQAKVLAPRPTPDGHSSIVNPTLGVGTVYGLNAYDADPRLATHLAPGTIQRVRFIEGVQPSGPGAVQPPGLFAQRRILGETPVEADGSFNVEVPADIPLIIQTLDTNGMALATCGWFWVKTRESRGCIGCHEDPERTPENDYVLALRRPSDRLAPPPEQRKTVTFKNDIAPILSRHCADDGCHAGGHRPLQFPPAAGDAALRKAWSLLITPAPTNTQSGAQLRPGLYLDPGQARTSWLVWQLLGTNTSRPWDLSGANQKSLPPHSPPLSGRNLSPEDLGTIIRWIDLGAPYSF